jgi:hypothetical protein
MVGSADGQTGTGVLLDGWTDRESETEGLISWLCDYTLGNFLTVPLSDIVGLPSWSRVLLDHLCIPEVHYSAETPR